MRSVAQWRLELFGTRCLSHGGARQGKASKILLLGMVFVLASAIVVGLETPAEDDGLQKRAPSGLREQQHQQESFSDFSAGGITRGCSRPLAGHADAKSDINIGGCSGGNNVRRCIDSADCSCSDVVVASADGRSAAASCRQYRSTPAGEIHSAEQQATTPAPSTEGTFTNGGCCERAENNIKSAHECQHEDLTVVNCRDQQQPPQHQRVDHRKPHSRNKEKIEATSPWGPRNNAKRTCGEGTPVASKIGENSVTERDTIQGGGMELGADENDVVRLTLGDDTAAIHLFGATILSWKAGAAHIERIYLSKTAIFDNKKAIRGGVPLVFPNFGPWSLGPQHGFARTSMWSLQRRKPHKAVFKLTETQTSLDMWPFKFEVFYTVELASEALHMRVDVRNTDEKPWDFTLLLHTYLRVEDIANTKIRGLDKVTYIDKVQGGSKLTQEGDVVISEATDRVYCNTGDVEVSDGTRSVFVEKNGLPDTVLWNPWVEGCASMGDLDDDAWQHMACVEAGKVSDRVLLQPGEIYIAKSTLRLAD